jgi:histone acetyltransferase (RNA polymerase elongator complex component)
MSQKPYEEIANSILEMGLDVQSAKIRACKKYALKTVPSNADILGGLSQDKSRL